MWPHIELIRGNVEDGQPAIDSCVMSATGKKKGAYSQADFIHLPTAN